MSFDISKIIERFGYNADKAAYFNNFQVTGVLYQKGKNFTIIKAENDCMLLYSLYKDVLTFFEENGVDNLKLYLKAKDQDLPIREINLYLEEYRRENNLFGSCVPVISEDGFVLSYTE